MRGLPRRKKKVIRVSLYREWMDCNDSFQLTEAESLFLTLLWTETF